MPHKMANPDMSLAFGIGFNTHFDYGMTQTQERTIGGGTEEGVPIPSVTSTRELKGHGGLSTISPAAALNCKDQYYFGASLNKSFMSNGSLEEEVTVGSATASEKWEATVGGTFLMVGARAKLSPEFSLGLTYRTGFTLKYSDMKTTGTRSDGSTYNYTDGDEEYVLPAIFGLGASYQASPKLLVVAEYQTRTFMDIEEIDYADPNDPIDPIDDAYYPHHDTLTEIDNGSAMRLGVEYQGSKFPMRFGFFKESIFHRDDVVINETTGARAATEKPNPMTGITGGLGLVKGNLVFDIYAEYYSWGKEYSDSDYDPVADEYTYTTRELTESHILIGVGVSYTLK